MAEPAKPFACSLPDCGMSFTNEDHLHVHTKKHDMVLQLGLEQKAAFVADQTPTPTRFIRNCEEVGLFQDLQNVAANPFDEGFKRAMEAKHGVLSLEGTMSNTDDVLHTPQMVFPLLDNAESTLFTNNQRNITISRSSSDESGTIKEFETRTISKLTNEVITISRIVNNTQNEDINVKQTDKLITDIETKIESNIIRKNTDSSKAPVLIYTDSVVKEASHANKDVIIDNNKLYVDKVPIMSQKSIDFVVDSLTSELGANGNQTVVDRSKKETKIDKCTELKIKTHVPNKDTKVTKRFMVQPKILPKEDIKVEPKTGDYEVIIKLPNGKHVKMKPVEEKADAKACLRNSITKRTVKNTASKLPIVTQVVKKPVPNVVKIPTGTLIPVTLVDRQGTPLSNDDLNKVPITKIGNVNDITTLTKIPVNVAKNASNVIKINAKTVNKPRPENLEATLTPIVTDNNCGIKVSQPYQIDKETGKRKMPSIPDRNTTTQEVEERIKENGVVEDADDDCVIDTVSKSPEMVKRTRFELENRCAASKRYRERLKEAMKKQSDENKLLREANHRLIAEKALLKLLITEHMKRCPNAADVVERLDVFTNGQLL